MKQNVQLEKQYIKIYFCFHYFKELSHLNLGTTHIYIYIWLAVDHGFEPQLGQTKAGRINEKENRLVGSKSE
jgi:hypothetical protein